MGGVVKLSMGARLGAGFACVLALTLALGAFPLVQMRQRQAVAAEIADLKEKVATERRAYERLSLSPPEREALGVFASSLDAYYTAGVALMALSSQGEKSFEAARKSINAPEGVLRKSFNAVLDRLDAMIVKGRVSGRAAEEASAAAQSLNAQARHLVEQVSFFRTSGTVPG